MATLDDVLAAVKALENGSELLEVVTSLKSTAETAQTGYRTVQQTHDKLVGNLKPLGYESGDPVAFLNSLKEKLEAGTNAGTKLTAKETEFDALKKTVQTLADAKTKADQRATQLAQRTLRETLQSRMKGRMIDPEGATALVLQDGLASIGEDGNISWKDGGDFEKGLSDFISARPHAQVNSQKPGAGGSGNNGGTSGKVMKRSDFEGLSGEAKIQFVKDKGKLED